MRLTTDPRQDGAVVTESRRPSRAASVMAIAAGLLLIFALDRATGSAPAQHLYYLPIILAGARFGVGGGVAAAVSAIVLYHLANPLLLGFQYQELDLVEVGLFIAVGIVTARIVSDARRLRQLASTDDLTGLQNLRAFEAALSDVVREARAERTAVSLLVLDLDRLKRLNDEYGHLTGAEAVRTVGSVIAAQLPSGGIACRYGGDEFVIAVAGITAPEAMAFANDLCAAVHASEPVLAGVAFPSGTLSISVGIGHRRVDWLDDESESDDEMGEGLFRGADAALYAAKRDGRNRVRVA